jgi:hypothetical protein
VKIEERIRNLSAATRGTPIEQDLARGRISMVAPVVTATPGATTPVVVGDQNPAACRHYGHEPFDVPCNEVTAWRLAYAMGDPWRQLLPTAVLRNIGGRTGVLVNHKDGKPNPDAFTDARGQVMAAALFDALIANQDRHALNYRYDATTRRLGLIDHGFAFARPGDFMNGSAFLAARLLAGPPESLLSPTEQRVLEVLLDSGDLHGLRGFLATDRADALEARAENMARNRCLPAVGAF